MRYDPWLRALIILAVAIAALHLALQVWQLALHFGDIIVLFFLAWLLSFMLRPFVWSLELIRLPRLVATVIVYLALLVALTLVGALIVPLAVAQLAQFGQTLPDHLSAAPQAVAGLQAELTARGVPIDLLGLLQAQNLGAQLERLVTRIVENTVAIIGGLASFVVAFVILLMLSFYFALDGDRLLRGIISVVPDPYEHEAHLFFASVGRAFGGYLRGLMIQMAVFVVATAIIMSIAGLPYIVLASLLAGLLVIIPFVGPTLAIMPPILIAVLAMPTWEAVVLVATALLVMQIVVVNVVAPKVLGDSVGLHPLFIFLAILIGAKQAGLAGAIFGVPVAAVVYASLLILLRRALHEPPLAEEDAEAMPLPAAGHLDRFARLRTTVSGAFTRRFPDTLRTSKPTPGGDG